MKKLFLIASLALLMALAAVTPALASSADDNCRHMLVNKQHLLDSDYVPSSLTPLSNYMAAGGNVTMTAEAAAAIGEMVDAMAAEGLTDIYGQSGYRSYATQKMLNDNKILYYRNLGYSYEHAVELACTVVAAPGASEHQSGLAIDFTTSANGSSLTDSFGTTPVGQWLAANSWKYGFILRYPADKTEITMEELKEYPCLSFDQGSNNSFFLAEEVLSTYEYKRIIKANDRATMLNLMVGLNGYTLCSGIICEELNGSDYRAVPLHADENMMIGYVSRKGMSISAMGLQYLEEIRKYKEFVL